MSPTLKKLLIVAGILYVAANSWMQVKLIERVSVLEHKIFHLSGGKDGHKELS